MLILHNILTNIACKEMFPVFIYVSVTLVFFFYCEFFVLIRDTRMLKTVLCVLPHSCSVRSQVLQEGQLRL